MLKLIGFTQACVLAGVFIGACSPASGAPSSPERQLAEPVSAHGVKDGRCACNHLIVTRGAVSQGEFDDPFAYCAAVGTIDAPDGRYIGPKLPESVIEAMIRQGIISRQASAEFGPHATWRCMSGKVWACTFGANLPCLEKADESRIPTRAMREFCAAHPAEEAIPAAVTGRATVYAWGCAANRPRIVKRLFSRDPQSYLNAFWHELAPP